MSTTSTFTVEGMTCDHCVKAVESAVLSVSGVTAVGVELATGRIEVTSMNPVDAEAIAAAVHVAGYVITSRLR